MSLAKKLNLKPGMTLRVIGRPRVIDLGDVSTTTGKADGVLVFAMTRADVEARSQAVVEAARADVLAWVAYPKGGQLGTDLNRDILWKQLQPRGLQPVRQVAIDDVWSALRFRVLPAAG